MGSRKSETTLEPQRYEELRSQPSIHCKLDVQHYRVFRLKIAFCISIEYFVRQIFKLILLKTLIANLDATRSFVFVCQHFCQAFS